MYPSDRPNLPPPSSNLTLPPRRILKPILTHLIIHNGLMNLLLLVHHKRTMLDDGFLYGLTSDDDEMSFRICCFDFEGGSGFRHDEGGVGFGFYGVGTKAGGSGEGIDEAGVVCGNVLRRRMCCW